MPRKPLRGAPPQTYTMPCMATAAQLLRATAGGVVHTSRASPMNCW